MPQTSPKPRQKRGRPRKQETALSVWLDREGLTRDDLAAKLDISRPHVDRLCRGSGRPGLELAIRIEKLSNGAVQAAGWAGVPAQSHDP